VVDIELTSFVEHLPERGFVEIVAEVRNRTNKEASWEFQFKAYEGYRRDGQLLRHSRNVTVGPAAVRRFRFRVPVYPTLQSSYSQQPRMSVRIMGPGTFTSDEYFFGNVRKNTGDLHRYVLVTDEALRTPDGSSLPLSEINKVCRDKNIPVHLQNFDADLFPDSEIALLGFDLLLMHESEWASFGRGREVLEAWIAQGGDVLLISEAKKEPIATGLGAVHTDPPFGSAKDLADTLSSFTNLSMRVLERGRFYENNWDMREAVPDIKKPIGVLMILVIAVAGILGPLNLGIAFRRRKSLQVLWTTPLLSIGISVLVGGIILFRDGLGGDGVRMQWVLLLPEQQLEVSWQEQVSRTGVLPSSGFKLDESWWLRPVATHRRDLRSPYSYGLQPGGFYEGDWFGNRRVQAQVAQRVQSSRAQVRVRWENQTPLLLSTVETPFSRILYRDSRGKVWKGEQITPGKTTPLVSVPSSEAKTMIGEMNPHKESLFPEKGMLNQKGWFYAEGLNAERMVDTLTSISWEDRAVWFLGPVVGETL